MIVKEFEYKLHYYKFMLILFFLGSLTASSISLGFFNENFLALKLNSLVLSYFFILICYQFYYTRKFKIVLSEKEIFIPFMRHWKRGEMVHSFNNIKRIEVNKENKNTGVWLYMDRENIFLRQSKFKNKFIFEEFVGQLTKISGTKHTEI